MSDPIVDMVRDYWLANEPVVWDELAKQIRQQIGRENKEKIARIVSVWWNGTQHNPDELVDTLIREVCQLEES